MTVAANLIIATLSLASIYALINVGFVLLYRTTGVINFAQGHFMLIGAYLMWALQEHVTYLVALFVTMAAMWVLASLIYLVLMRFLLGTEEFTKVITTLMLATILLQVPAMIWGTSVRVLKAPVHTTFHLSSLSVQASDLITIAEAIALVSILTVGINRTLVGTRMRAVASDESLAVYGGIRVHRMASLAWGLAGAGAALAGVSYAQSSAVSLSLPNVALGAFPAVVIGGLDSIGGSLLGGLVVAAIQTFTTYWMGAVYGDVFSFLVMLAVLMVRPTGLYGSAEGRRV